MVALLKSGLRRHLHLCLVTEEAALQVESKMNGLLKSGLRKHLHLCLMTEEAALQVESKMNGS